MPAKHRPTIREVVLPGDPGVSKGYKLLTSSFHKAELVDRQEWRLSLREREAELWSDIRWHLVIAEVGRRTIGVVTGSYLGNVNTGIIGYLAVSPADGGSGVGPKLRKKLVSLFRQDAQQICGKPLAAVVGEVRRDNPWLRSLVRQQGVLVLDFGYIQPGLYRGGHSVPLMLYYQAFDRVRHRLATSLIRKLLYTMWRRVYRIDRPMGHVAFRRMLRELAGRQSIGAATLAALKVRTYPRAPHQVHGRRMYA